MTSTAISDGVAARHPADVPAGRTIHQTAGINRLPALLAALALAGGALWLADAVSGRQAVLYLLGAGLGITLYHAAFGFTLSFRAFLTDRRGAGIRAQMVMLAVACALFFPALGNGSLFGQPVNGIIFPVGTAVIVGAFMFGIGMQIAGACASGTLYTAGGGSTAMLLTLAFFIVGATVGAAHLPWWNELPRFESVSLIAEMGWVAALALNLAVFGAVYLLTLWLEKRRHGDVESERHDSGAMDGPVWRRVIRGRWPLLWGAVALAVLNFATLAVAGRPWGITTAFTLWGSQIALPWYEDLLFWDYWADASQAAALESSIFTDVVSVMNFGLVAGAMLAAALAGRFAPTLKLPVRILAASIIGGLLLGYGARIGTGCNISAYFGGVASGSLHGWIWLPAALAGNWIGLYLRPLFRPS